jgi:uncharacterized membrane protein YesL
VKQLLSAWQVIQEALTAWWYSWLVLMLLNTLLVLCWISIVLGPPATFGFYYAVYSLVTSHSTDWREFLEGAKKYFFKAWLWALLNLVVVVLLVVSVDFYSQFAETTMLLIPILFIGIIWLCVQIYALPYFMAQEQKRIFLALRNALFTLLASPLYSLVLFLFVAFVLWLSTLLPILFVIGSPALIAVLGVHAVKERVKTFQIVPSEHQNDEPTSA